MEANNSQITNIEIQRSCNKGGDAVKEKSEAYLENWKKPFRRLLRFEEASFDGLLCFMLWVSTFLLIKVGFLAITGETP